MTDKNFDNLPEQDIKIEGVEKPKPSIDYLDEYYKTLGDGTIDFIGIKTGLKKLDLATLGLDGVIVLGGIAGAGKTSLALQLAFEACQLGTPIIFYSLEMPRRAIYTKILNRLAKVKYTDILLKGRPYLDPDQMTKNLLGEEIDFKSLLAEQDADNLKKANDKLKEVGKKFYVRSLEAKEPEINFETAEQDINLIKAEHNADKVLVVVDHLQVFKTDDARDQIDRENKLITGFKGLSERTGATTLLISQKNKQGFTSSGLQTIKGSVDIVYLADVVMFLDTPQEDKKDRDAIDEVIFSGGDKNIELHLQKNRYNSPTMIKLKFDGKYSMFEELS
jgi:replicative DNA helicase